MLLMSQLEAVEVAIGQAEDELEVACGGEAKVRMDKVETEMAKIVAAAFSGKSTRVQLTPPKDQGPGSPAVHQTVEPEPEPEPKAKPKPDPQRRASSRKAACGAPASLPPLVSELFEEMEKRKANLPALLRRQDVTGSGRLRCEQLGAAVRSGGLSMSAEQAKQLAYQLVAAGEEHAVSALSECFVAHVGGAAVRRVFQPAAGVGSAGVDLGHDVGPERVLGIKWAGSRLR